MMDSYSDFARFYESLMEDARYPERADYLLSLCARFNHETGLCLDLACGTGSLTRELQSRGVDVFGVDGSEDMLCEAMRGDGILYICQDMRELELAENIDTCFCTLDSLNHLTELSDVEETLFRVGRYMNGGGLPRTAFSPRFFWISLRNRMTAHISASASSFVSGLIRPWS